MHHQKLHSSAFLCYFITSHADFDGILEDITNAVDQARTARGTFSVTAISLLF
jgi:hypothetical protein